MTTDWANAPCRHIDPELWFPPRHTDPDAIAAAAICAECPLKQPCRDTARTQGLQGVWGGTYFTTNGTERTIRPPRTTPDHGTERGYQRHHYTGTTTCDPCRKAHRAYNVTRDAQRKAAA